VSPRPYLCGLKRHIEARRNDATTWRALAAWLLDNGRDDEATAVRLSWPTLRDNVVRSGMSLDQVALHAKVLGRWAREAEE
jgi:hypothetical protein